MQWHCLLLKYRLKERKSKESLCTPKCKLAEAPSAHRQSPDVDTLAQAEREIIRSVQHEHFEEEIRPVRSLNVDGEFMDRGAAQQRDTSLKKTSCIHHLDPYLDAEAILRVGGLLRRANRPEDIKHPVILPRGSHVTELIIQDCHHATRHQGSGMTHNESRQQGYWIIGGTSAVGSYVSKCTICRKLRTPGQLQKMADLATD